MKVINPCTTLRVYGGCGGVSICSSVVFCFFVFIKIFLKWGGKKPWRNGSRDGGEWDTWIHGAQASSVYSLRLTQIVPVSIVIVLHDIFLFQTFICDLFPAEEVLWRCLQSVHRFQTSCCHQWGESNERGFSNQVQWIRWTTPGPVRQLLHSGER